MFYDNMITMQEIFKNYDYAYRRAFDLAAEIGVLISIQGPSRELAERWNQVAAEHAVNWDTTRRLFGVLDVLGIIADAPESFNHDDAATGSYGDLMLPFVMRAFARIIKGERLNKFDSGIRVLLQKSRLEKDPSDFFKWVLPQSLQGWIGKVLKYV